MDERIHRGEGWAVSQFIFLQREWSAVFDAAAKAEVAVHSDPRTACFYARRALELAVAWAIACSTPALAAVSRSDIVPSASKASGKSRNR